jgi:ABC-2 type transport system permease protein
MNAIRVIALRDLRAYFSTLSGYLILAGHLLLSGMLFNIYAVGNQPKQSQLVLEHFFYFSSGIAMIAAVMLSVRLIAEERQLNTLVLLRTAPVTERQIILGKYLSALAFFVLMLALSAYMPALILVRGKISVLQIGAGYLALLLLGSSCIAMTLLASVWSGSQIVAGAVAGVMVTVLLVLWMLAQVSAEPLRGLLAFLALHNLHFGPMSRGVVHIRDVAFYVGLTVVFLEAAVRSLESWRWRE